ncbi:GSU2403 family nucleotidyltransferase fold protein [Pelagibius sp. Alg239-R121]|uniref:nucleotidyltransferase family protein n=1 Tax=Pelagibius sp. Alg239-R121 TaxID=2993448 RepID=UPI0024A67A53|nr:GSU2403 family nucleotidyltransferase fold protein [Pelagibius sp. Alg239-R121]
MIDRHSPTAHAAYHDLLRSLKEEIITEIRGTPGKVERNGKVYWYDTYRVGSDVRKTYIGENSPELTNRIARIKDLRAQSDVRSKHRTRLIKILRAEGFMGVDAATGSLLSAMAHAGVFRLGGTIVGTHAFRLYEGILGARYTFDQMAQTGDIDIASFERLSLALEDSVSPPLQKVLSDFSFEPVPGLDKQSIWRWRQTRNDLQVEFLTPSFQANEGIRPLAALGVNAQSLHHLNYLIAGPQQAVAVYRGGVLVQVPRPERFAIHKLIVADRRRDNPGGLKSTKDRLQAEFLIKILAEDRPDELKEAFITALETGPKWQERLDRSLAKLPESKELLFSL